MTFSIRPRCRRRTIPTSHAMSCPQRGRTVASFKRLLPRWINEFQIYLTSPRENCALKPGRLAQMVIGLAIEQVIARKLMQELMKARIWRLRCCPKLRRSIWYPPPHPPQSNVRILHPSTLPSSCQRRLLFSYISRLFRLSKTGAFATTARQFSGRLTWQTGCRAPLATANHS